MKLGRLHAMGLSLVVFVLATPGFAKGPKQETDRPSSSLTYPSSFTYKRDSDAATISFSFAVPVITRGQEQREKSLTDTLSQSTLAFNDVPYFLQDVHYNRYNDNRQILNVRKTYVFNATTQLLQTPVRVTGKLEVVESAAGVVIRDYQLDFTVEMPRYSGATEFAKLASVSIYEPAKANQVTLQLEHQLWDYDLDVVGSDDVTFTLAVPYLANNHGRITIEKLHIKADDTAIAQTEDRDYAGPGGGGHYTKFDYKSSQESQSLPVNCDGYCYLDYFPGGSNEQMHFAITIGNFKEDGKTTALVYQFDYSL